jgi:hypothetical protein
MISKDMDVLPTHMNLKVGRFKLDAASKLHILVGYAPASKA